MRKPSVFLPLLFVVVVELGGTRVAQADFVVAEGWDLFKTDSAQFDFGGPIGFQEFEGVPLGTFDFGGTIGVQNTGDADTIVQRLAAADSGGVPGTDTIPIELVALSLVSVNPIDIGSGAEILDATINIDNGSSMDITFDDMNGGIFDSTLDFDVKFTGQTSGDMVVINKIFTATGNDWQRAPTGNIVIDGVNHFLKGDSTEDQDFWPVGVVTHDAGVGTHHDTIAVPEPSAFLCGGFAIIALFLGRSRRRPI